MGYSCLGLDDHHNKYNYNPGLLEFYQIMPDSLPAGRSSIIDKLTKLLIDTVLIIGYIDFIYPCQSWIKGVCIVSRKNSTVRITGDFIPNANGRGYTWHTQLDGNGDPIPYMPRNGEIGDHPGRLPENQYPMKKDK